MASSTIDIFAHRIAGRLVGRSVNRSVGPGQGMHWCRVCANPSDVLLPFLTCTGGYMVGAGVSARYIFDLQPGDMYWCTADCGWITGHGSNRVHLPGC